MDNKTMDECQNNNNNNDNNRKKTIGEIIFYRENRKDTERNKNLPLSLEKVRNSMVYVAVSQTIQKVSHHFPQGGSEKAPVNQTNQKYDPPNETRGLLERFSRISTTLLTTLSPSALIRLESLDSQPL